MSFLDNNGITALTQEYDARYAKMLDVYPVGAVYISVNSTSPETLFGGTWQAINNNATIFTGTPSGEITYGGASDNKITNNNLPSHQHEMVMKSNANLRTGGTASYLSAGAGNTYYTGMYGGSQAYFPYHIKVYMWVRTA